MRTRTKALTAAAAALLAVGAFAAGAAADGTDAGDVGEARSEMHAQMGGGPGTEPMGDHWSSMSAVHDGMDPAAMDAMHEAMDPAAMDAMHDAMVELLPPELRDEADAMHRSMPGAMTGRASGGTHESHHPDGS